MMDHCVRPLIGQNENGQLNRSLGMARVLAASLPAVAPLLFQQTTDLSLFLGVSDGWPGINWPFVRTCCD